MKTPLDYLMLAILLLPTTALLAVLICHAWPRRQDNRSWHSKHAGTCLQIRTRR